MPGGKTQTWVSLTPEQQNERRAEFVTAGIGGRSKLNRDFWIDDSAENEYGWNESVVSRSAQLERARAGWLTQQIKQRFKQRLDLLKVRKKPVEIPKATTR
jgi:hypothetical protein